MAAETPTLSGLTHVPELGQMGTPMSATPTTFPISSSVAPAGAPSLLSQIATGGQNALLQRLGVTNPNAGFLDMLKQSGLSQVAGGPFVGYNPGSSFLSNLAGAGRQRLFSSLFPESGGRSPQDLQQAIQMMLAQQGRPARQLPVYGNLPGYG
jgi:hypothetical protein